MAHRLIGVDSSGVTREDIEHLARTGQLTIDRPIYTPQELAEVQTLMDGIRTHLSEVPDDYVVDLAKGKGPAQVDEVLWPSRLEPRLKRTKVFSKTRHIAEVLLGGPVTLHFDHHIQKTPFSDYGTLWHQDQGFEVDAAVKGTFWIPAIDVDEVNGCMWFVPKSQELGLLPHDRIGTAGIVVRDVDETNAISAPLRRGGLSVHRELTLHSSKPNRTEFSRPAWILRFRRDDVSPMRMALNEVRSGTSSAPGLSRLTRVKHKQ
jgi:phytanoyl-CoA hydroxylase